MIIAEILVLILALLLAVVRGLPGPAAAPLRALAVVYTDFFRGTPIVIIALLTRSACRRSASTSPGTT